MGWVVLCTALISLVAIADFLTGYELSLSILYLGPVFLATWILGRRAGIAFCFISLGAWLISVEFMGHVYSHPFYHFWEAVIRIATWVGFAWMLGLLKTALARADERFMTVLARLDAAVYVADTATGELLFMNERCSEAFGHDLRNAREIERRLHAPGELDNPSRPMAERAQVEVRDARTGSWYLVAARAIRWIDGRSVRLHIATDVTDRKRAEELAREHQERLEMTSRLTALGEVASTLAHEINQPLAAIANYCMGCVRRLRSGDWKREELLEAMEKSAAQAERAGNVIQRARQFLRRREFAAVACGVNAMIVSAARMIEVEGERRGARLHLELGQDLPQVLADPIMIEQAMLNLLKNALEAMEFTPAPSRNVTIRSTTQEPGLVRVEIVDRGAGLPAQLKDVLFLPFFTTKADGMGIGLHICRSIIERHGGRLWATPNPAGGSILHFTLPVSRT